MGSELNSVKQAHNSICMYVHTTGMFVQAHTQTCGTSFVQVHVNIWLVRELDVGWLAGWLAGSLLAGWLAGWLGSLAWLAG